jgi:hypothetical protein
MAEGESPMAHGGEKLQRSSRRHGELPGTLESARFELRTDVDPH